MLDNKEQQQQQQQQQQEEDLLPLKVTTVPYDLFEVTEHEGDHEVSFKTVLDFI